jgi:hypothetical protein
MIEVDGHKIDYEDNRRSRKFRAWILTQNGRAFELEFVNMARELLRDGRKASGYAIGQWARERGRRKLHLPNEFGPLLGRLAVAKHPELAAVLTFKTTGYGKGEGSKPPDDGEDLFPDPK